MFSEPLKFKLSILMYIPRWFRVKAISVCLFQSEIEIVQRDIYLRSARQSSSHGQCQPWNC